MNLLTEKYNLETRKVNKNIKLLFISDIHYMDNISEEYNNNIINKSKDISPDYIILGGDYFCGMGKFSFENKSSMDCLKELINGLKQISPVILILGNHDLSIKNDLKYRKLFKKLKSKNVYPLDNETIEFSNITFSGFFYNRKAYAISKINKNKIKIIIDDWNNTKFKLNKNKYNVLCHHIPDTIFDDRFKEHAKGLLGFDLILSGHTHNGWLKPKREEKLINKLNKRIEKNPNKKDILEIKKYGGGCESIINNPPFKRKYCRGIHNIENLNLIISKGITTGLKISIGNMLLIDTGRKYGYVTEVNIGGINEK